MIFTDLKIGDRFLCNCTVYIKKSSRTALLLKNGRVFYFRENENVSAVK